MRAVRVALVILGLAGCGSVDEPTPDADADAGTDSGSDSDTGTSSDGIGIWGDCVPAPDQTCLEWCTARLLLCQGSCQAMGLFGGTLTFANPDCEEEVSVLACDGDPGGAPVRCCC